MAPESLTCDFKGRFPPSSHDDLDTADEAAVVVWPPQALLQPVA